MWQVAKFESTALFSLRPLNATTSGGKTLLTPTPYAVKMGLLDVAIRVFGRAQGEAWFPVLRDLRIAVQLPRHIVVNNTFIKILRPHKSGPKDVLGTGLEGPLGNTIAYRELVQYGGPLWLAVEARGKISVEPPFGQLLAQLNYLGKRGGFMQFQAGEMCEQLSASFVHLNPEAGQSFQVNGVLQILDDCGPKMSFEQADVFSGKGISVGKPNGRLAQPVVLPYQPIRSSRSFTLYECVNR